jgi:hypothetical protein
VVAGRVADAVVAGAEVGTLAAVAAAWFLT